MIAAGAGAGSGSYTGGKKLWAERPALLCWQGMPRLGYSPGKERPPQGGCLLDQMVPALVFSKTTVH